MTLKLTAEKRDVRVKPAKLAKTGKIPAVFYGRRTVSTPIAVDTADFTKLLKTAGESSVLELEVDGQVHECLISEVNRDPIKNTPRHADFYVFEKGQKLKIKVPLEFVGVAPAIKDMGGVLVKVLHEMEIESAPKDLPKNIEVDIAPLINFESQILAKDVKLPKGVSLVTLPDEVVASVYEAKEEVVEVAPVAPDLSAIEVEKKGKKEEEGEAAPAGAASKEAPAAEKKGAGEKK